MKAKRYLALFLIPLALLFVCAAALVVYVDPFFHYHAPHSDSFFYTIDNERSMNNGILKHFDYDAIITGSSMTANFKTSELDEIFGTNAVKVSAAGASFYEINNLINTALEHKPELKYVFRSIDRNLLVYGSNELRSDMGEYPSYLYDNNIFNDYEYVLNADVLFDRTLSMLAQTRQPDFVPGHTSFDDYSSTNDEYVGEFGLEEIGGFSNFDMAASESFRHLSEEERKKVEDNIYQNVVATAEAHPDTTFYCFMPPYSLWYWYERMCYGDILAQLEAEQIAIELMLQCHNIKLFDFSVRTDITSDVNNYRDRLHYGEWVNSLILRWMHDEQYMLTEDNYEDVLAKQRDYYLSADYAAFSDAERYHSDYYAAALLNQELRGAISRRIEDDELLSGELKNAEFATEAETGDTVIRCSGALARIEEWDLGAYLFNDDYSGLRLRLDDAGSYSYLCFKGRNTGHHGQPSAAVYDEAGNCLSLLETNYYELEGGWQIFTLDLRNAQGPAYVILNGAFTDYTGHPSSSFEFKELMLY